MNNKLRWLIATTVFLGALAFVIFGSDSGRVRAPVSLKGASPSADQSGFSPQATALVERAAPAGGANSGAAPTLARPEAVDDPTAREGALEGLVLSATTSLGVAGAELTFERSATAASTRTDGAGRFTFAPPQAGTWRLAAVSAQGFLPFAPEWGHSPIVFQSEAGKRIRGARVTLTPAVDTLGVVLSPSREPVRGAEIRLLGASAGEQALIPLPDRFTSNDKGEFHFQAPDGATLEARHPDFAPGRASLDFSARVSRRLVITLGARKGGAPAPGTIVGRVVDPRGAPAAGALVSASVESKDFDENPSSQAAANAQGRFRLEGLEAKSYRVVAQQEGFAPASRSGVSPGASELVLELGDGARLVGSVKDGAGRPVPSFTISVFRRDGPLRLDRVASDARLDPQGQFEIAGLPSGAALATASAFGLAPSKPLEVALSPAPAPPARADFTLFAGASLSGMVVERGTRRPLAGARVEAEGIARSTEAGSAAPNLLRAATDAAGAFALSGLPAGRLSIEVSAADHHGRIVPGIQVPESGNPDPVVVELTPVESGQEPRLELAGLGMVLQAQGDALVVNRLIAQGGGAEAGLVLGDAILAIDGKPAVELGFEGAVNVIRGPEGSDVTLTVRRADGQVVELVARRKIVRN